MKSAILALALAPILVLSAACGDDTEETETMETDETDEPEATWQEMSFDERKTYMQEVVVPTMKPLFEEYDERFVDMNCRTCHGDGAGEGTFTMPYGHLWPIDFADFPTGPGADFMQGTVVPTMTGLLDSEPFDPETGEGFGCLSCHPAAE